MDDQLNTTNAPAVDQTTTNQPVDQTQTTPADDALAAMAPTGETAQEKMQKEVADELMNQDLMKLLKFDTLPTEKQEEIKQKMIDTILGRMIARIMDALSDDDKKAFEEVLDKNDEKATEEFLKGKVNVRDILVQETMLYKAEMIDNAQKIDEMVRSASDSQKPADDEEKPNVAIV